MEFMSYDMANEVVNELFMSLLSRYQICLETSMSGRDFIFDSIHLLYYKCHKIIFRRGDSYIYSPDWIKKKKATINSINEDDKCFQYTVVVALNCKGIKSDPERISNIKPIIKKCNRIGITYPSKLND